MRTKICSKCRAIKPLIEFHKHHQQSDGRHPTCKICRSMIEKEYRIKNKNRITIKQKEYRIKNRKHIRIRQKERHNTILGYLIDIFHCIKQRCTNINDPGFKYYGNRDIKCLFGSSQGFINYVVNELKVDPRGLQIDRINNDGHYEKGNIRFVTAKENCNNRKNSK